MHTACPVSAIDAMLHQRKRAPRGGAGGRVHRVGESTIASRSEHDTSSWPGRTQVDLKFEKYRELDSTADKFMRSMSEARKVDRLGNRTNTTSALPAPTETLAPPPDKPREER